MKLLMENWREFLKEEKTKVFFWQTRGPWKGDKSIKYGVTHVPQATTGFGRNANDAQKLEDLFEKVRQRTNPDAVSRLNCVYLCEHLEGLSPYSAGGAYCGYPPEGGGETYIIQLRGDYKIFKTDSEYWSEAGSAVQFYQNWKDAEEWAEEYWKGASNPTLGEILVYPPEAAIIVGKYTDETRKTHTDEEGDDETEYWKDEK
tara:strand:+ start:541 stop:1146 length:606 start_codon:yes stop_codon:yes gene_type:complete